VAALADSGASLAVAVIAVALSIGALGATGLYAAWGVNPGVQGEDPQQVEDDPGFSDPDDSSPSGGGLLGSVRAGLNFLSSTVGYIGKLPGMLIGVGVPAPFAQAFGAVALVTISWTFARFIRGVL
jgi:hypothetical protein